MDEIKVVLDKILDKQEKMDDNIHEIKECQIRMEVDLEHHIKRTDILETMVKPVYNITTTVKTLLKGLAAVGLILGVIVSYNKAFGYPYDRHAKQLSIPTIVKKIERDSGCLLNIHSYIRTPKENAKVGGAKRSYHLYGRAIDVSSNCVSLKQLAKIASKYSTVILYGTHLHIDNRKDKTCLIKEHKKYYKLVI